MSQEEDQASLVLVARKLGIPLRIVRKKKRTRTPRRAHSREISQGTRNTPVKHILVKSGFQMKKMTPKIKMLQPWCSR
jgi:hypothetical protein